MTIAQVLELIRAERGLELHLSGFFAGGEVGAADVCGGDGTRYVLKWWEGDAEAGRRAASLVDGLRQVGYPAPRFVLADDVGGVTVMLQEFVVGEATDAISESVIDRLLQLNALQVGAGPTDGASWTDYIVGSLLHGCHGYCVHQPLRDYDRRTRSLLELIQQAGQDVEQLPSGDAVHIDFHHRNVLVAESEVSAVIDWEGCRTGDAAFDLVTLAFGLSVAEVSAQAREAVWQEACRRTVPTVRRAYAAHMALRQVDWSIRHRTPADIDHWLGVALELLDA